MTAEYGQSQFRCRRRGKELPGEGRGIYTSRGCDMVLCQKPLSQCAVLVVEGPGGWLDPGSLPSELRRGA